MFYSWQSCADNIEGTTAVTSDQLDQRKIEKSEILQEPADQSKTQGAQMYIQGLHKSGPFWQLPSCASICLSWAEPIFSGQANTASSCSPLSFPNRINILQGSKWLEMTHHTLHCRYGTDVPLTMTQTKPGTCFWVSVLWLRALAPVNSQFKFPLISWESLEELSNGMTLQMQVTYLFKH